MEKIRVGEFDIVYWQAGFGPGILFAHCSSGNHKEWIKIANNLSPNYHVIAPDLIGYGQSTPWPSHPPKHPASDLDVIEELIKHYDGPVHLVAHSYGAAACLEAARRDSETGANKVKSLFVIEPVTFHLLKTESCAKEWNQITRLANRVIGGVKKGNYATAANSFMGFWLGPIKWRLAPKRFRQSVIQTIHKVAHEFSIIDNYHFTADAYSNISCPVTIISGARTKKPALAITEILTRHITNSQHHIIPGAGHMSPFTHSKEVKQLLDEHLARNAI